MLFLVSRSTKRDDHFLFWKVRLFAIGATLGLAGIFLDLPLLVWAAIAVLVIGFLMRFVPRPSRRASESGPNERTDEE
jgi:membrane protein implicated in regulation of membrane protease activity